jgi:antitoxin (DNA-binding transcriptional repressor) of toxin-antitoxin stability system
VFLSDDEETAGGYLGDMRTVGIKVLKAKLSEYIRMVKGGETVLVTERDEVVAELRPARRQPVGKNTLEKALHEMAERGEVTLASRPVGEWKGFITKVDLQGWSPQQVLDEMREDAS